ncbi:hypothetical protein [Clostridium tetani]|uniref:hypothetical protein n=1 Tax=Clostridium tetani TaxID=1513 RepID=UPI000513038C|nr:hypothetical protein [Clostridium tetani]KGI44856.1 hypothetical protein KY55_02520 [Clostridium tetani]RXI70702.1 hypothetical protein DP127_08715 [Clostridium tetani]BDR76122.1 hypothetical protein K154306013_17820 [Clostridium tetani]BDR87239.1 hypothetical protein N071400001_18470 [Clostridium tetani]
MKKVLTLREKSMLNNGFFGAVWIGMGFIQVFKANKILLIIAAIILLVGSVSMFIPYFIKSELEDEMAEYNKNRAKSTVYGFLSLGISICTLIAIFKGEWVINLKIILPFVLGGVNFLEFIFFVIYEKVGA